MMKFYKCNVCGNIIEVVEEHSAALVCCGQNMELLEPNTVDAAVEKHVPVAKYEGETLHVQVGSVAHPMLEEHYITFIVIKAGDFVARYDLHPNGKPEASFEISNYHGTIEVYEHCNLHGLWKSEITI